MFEEAPWLASREFTLYDLLRDLFVASAITCLLLGLHRIGHGLMLTGRIKAFEKLGDAYTPEERETLIHSIKAESFRR